MIASWRRVSRNDSPHAVTVTGDAWCRLIGSYGRFDMGRVLSPAIGAAENGYYDLPDFRQWWIGDR
ncbi:hypothetical protein PY650_21600 [Rhizobium calliandrae]|uniref:Uncharacterized protein n=1 Tax=Rhizobium calliandrae TaxID=1312182 RepID=A0ABT7KHS8_9HYPH|nr:hypothetical protein [Rhizobium calliandrae]MDL2408195.1 hypothetical protein [Rhizobium calliandrae]